MAFVFRNCENIEIGDRRGAEKGEVKEASCLLQNIKWACLGPKREQSLLLSLYIDCMKEFKEQVFNIFFA